MPVQAAPEPVPEAPPLADVTPDVVDTSRRGADGSGRPGRGVPLAEDRADARDGACAVTEASRHWIVKRRLTAAGARVRWRGDVSCALGDVASPIQSRDRAVVASAIAGGATADARPSVTLSAPSLAAAMTGVWVLGAAAERGAAGFEGDGEGAAETAGTGWETGRATAAAVGAAAGASSPADDAAVRAAACAALAAVSSEPAAAAVPMAAAMTVCGASASAAVTACGVFVAAVVTACVS